MPDPNKKPATAAPKKVAAIQSSAENESNGEEWVYPELKVHQRWAGTKDGPLTEADIDAILGWETEKDYIERMKGLHPELPSEMFEFRAVNEQTGRSIKDHQICFEDEEKNWVTCWNVVKQRSFDRELALKLGHSILARHWAGPTCYPGETVNGSAFEVTRRGHIHNGMHRGIGYKLACQLWRKQHAHWSPSWPTAPVLDTLLITGISDNPAIIRTIDDARPRTDGDVIFTSEWFDSYKTWVQIDEKTRRQRPASNKERKELSRMLQKAVDFVWSRTGQEDIDQFSRYRDHAATVEFINRHKRLVACVQHLFEENKERVLSNPSYRLSPGQCAGMMYLMGSAKSDEALYRNVGAKGYDETSERKLDWELWDDAKAFWEMLVRCDKHGNPIDPNAKAIKNVLVAPGNIPDVEGSEEGEEDEEVKSSRAVERQVVLAKAWQTLVKNPKARLREEDLQIDYVQRSSDGAWILNSFDDFGGIDTGPRRPAEKKVGKDEGEDAGVTEKKAKRKESAEGLAERMAALKAKKAEEEERKRLADSPLPKKPEAKKPAPAATGPKRQSQASVNAAQTAKALKADREEAAKGNKAAAAAVAVHAKTGLKGGL